MTEKFICDFRSARALEISRRMAHCELCVLKHARSFAQLRLRSFTFLKHFTNQKFGLPLQNDDGQSGIYHATRRKCGETAHRRDATPQNGVKSLTFRTNISSENRLVMPKNIYHQDFNSFLFHPGRSSVFTTGPCFVQRR